MSNNTTKFFTAYYCNFIYILLSMILYFFCIISSQKTLKNSLAFSVNIMYSSNINKSYRKVKSIEFEKVNFFYKTIIYNYNKFYSQPSRGHIVYNLFNFVDNLEFSGSVHKNRIYYLKNNSRKYNIRNITLNPILSKIVILNARNLKIPQNLLNAHFVKYLGLPKNYKELNHSINRVSTWYKQKGFNYVFIDLFNNDSRNNIYIAIYEGIIDSIDLTCNSRMTLNPHQLEAIEKRIKEELSIEKGKVLNVKNLKCGIQKLYDIKLISRCKYKIINENNRIKIKILYKVDPQQYRCINTKYSSVIQDQELIHSPNITDISYYLFRRIKSFLNLSLTVPIKIMNILRLQPIISYQLNYARILERKLNLRHCKLYIDSRKFKSIIYDIKSFNNYTTFDVYFSYLSLYISHSTFIDYFIYLYNDVYIKAITYPLNLLSNWGIDKPCQYIYNSLRKSWVTKLKIKHKLYNSINFSENISFIYDSINQNSIMVNNKYLYRNYNGLHRNLNFDKNMLQKILRVDICFKFNYLDLSAIIEEGSLFICRIISIMSLPFSKIEGINLNSSLRQFLYLHYHKAYFIKPFTKLIQNAFIMSTEFYWPIKSISDGEIKLRGPLDHTSSNSCVYKILDSYSKMTFLFNIEYHLIANSYCSIYIFNNYIYKNKVYTNINSTDYTNLYPDSMNSNILNLGFGLQFNVPLRNLPPLRIEHYTSNNIKIFSQLRIYSKYSKSKI